MEPSPRIMALVIRNCYPMESSSITECASTSYSKSICLLYCLDSLNASLFYSCLLHFSQFFSDSSSHHMPEQAVVRKRILMTFDEIEGDGTIHFKDERHGG